MSVDPFKAMMESASDPSWRAHVDEAGAPMDVAGVQGLDAGIYLACFNTPAGRAVLQDLYTRYVNVSRVVPGEPDGSGFYREGAAQVVFLIASQVEAAAEGLDYDNQASTD
jgi:hypothetical protein